jgi:hypothetical protein
MIRILYDFVPCGPKDEPGLKVSYEYIEHAYEQVPSEYYRRLDNLLFGHLIPYRARKTCNRRRLIYPRRKRAKKE